MAKVILLVITVTAASARHVYNMDRRLVQPVNPEFDINAHNDQLVQRRNSQYVSVINNFQRKPEVSYNYYHIQDPSIVMNQESINSDSSNYIGNEHDFRLRTSLRPDGRKLEGVNGGLAFTNVKMKIDNNYRREPCSRVKTTQSTILPTEYEGTLKTNVNVVNVGTMNSTPVNNRTGGEVPKRPAQKAPKVPKNSETEDRKVDMSQNENERWSWGMSDKGVAGTTTTPLPDDDDLDDRVALAGDKCPTGLAKVGGKCVDKI